MAESIDQGRRRFLKQITAVTTLLPIMSYAPFLVSCSGDREKVLDQVQRLSTYKTLEYEYLDALLAVAESVDGKEESLKDIEQRLQGARSEYFSGDNIIVPGTEKLPRVWQGLFNDFKDHGFVYSEHPGDMSALVESYKSRLNLSDDEVIIALSRESSRFIDALKISRNSYLGEIVESGKTSTDVYVRDEERSVDFEYLITSRKNHGFRQYSARHGVGAVAWSFADKVVLDQDVVETIVMERLGKFLSGRYTENNLDSLSQFEKAEYEASVGMYERWLSSSGDEKKQKNVVGQAVSDLSKHIIYNHEAPHVFLNQNVNPRLDEIKSEAFAFGNEYRKNETEGLVSLLSFKDDPNTSSVYREAAREVYKKIKN